jgi:hypothetical protein
LCSDKGFYLEFQEDVRAAKVPDKLSQWRIHRLKIGRPHQKDFRHLDGAMMNEFFQVLTGHLTENAGLADKFFY